MSRADYKHWCDRHGPEAVRRLAREGLCEEEMALRLGLTVQLFRRWRKRYPELQEAMTLGREGADFAVVRALYKKATGYNVALSKTYKLKKVDYDPDTGKKLREYEELATGLDETHVPADLRAETFWLKNRRPEEWSERPEKQSEEESEEGGLLEIPSADLLGGE